MHGDTGQPGEMRGDQHRLVETTIAFLRGMERDRYKRVDVPEIGQQWSQERGEVPCPVWLAIILHSLDGYGRPPVIDGGRPRNVDHGWQVSAAADGIVERLAASPAVPGQVKDQRLRCAHVAK